MKIHANTEGFSLVEGLLILLILAVVGFAGYYVYNTHSSSTKNVTASTTATTKTAPKTSTSNQTATTTPSTNSKWLVIKEWGVEIPQPSGDMLSYDELSTQYDPESLSLVSHNLITYGCTSEGAGQIFRGTAAATVGPGTPITTSGTKIGDYYYVFMHDNASCSDPGAKNVPADAQSNANKEGQAAFTQIRAIPGQ